MIHSMPSNDNYRNNFDRIFRVSIWARIARFFRKVF